MVLINLVFTKVDLSRYEAIKNRNVGISDLVKLYTEDLFTELMGFICQRYALKTARLCRVSISQEPI